MANSILEIYYKWAIYDEKETKIIENKFNDILTIQLDSANQKLILG